MNMDETVIVSAIIDKITSSWKDYKRSLKHKKKDVTLEELGQHFRKEAKHHQHPKGKKRKFDLKKNQNSNKKHKGVCHHCGKPGHFKRDCHLLKKKNEENTSKFWNNFKINNHEILIKDSEGLVVNQEVKDSRNASNVIVV
ncbi:hypothetical protein ACOSQ3_031723 [Xanthoceras sorbifolium]